MNKLVKRKNKSKKVYRRVSVHHHFSERPKEEVAEFIRLTKEKVEHALREMAKNY